MAEKEVERHIYGQIEDLPTPCDSQKLFGHGEILQSLAMAYKSNRLHHALLFCGLRGIGKATSAFHFARHILANPDIDSAGEKISNENWSPSLQAQIANSSHPQFLYLQKSYDEKTKKFKSQLAVDDIRQVQNFYKLTSGDGGFRITVLDSADDMNVNAANALLKILEEPPNRSLFLIISHSPNSLLATIRSRCQRINFSPLSNELVVEGLAHMLGRGVEGGLGGADKNCDVAENFNRAAELASGSLRRAIEISKGRLLEPFSLFETLMQQKAKGEAGEWHKVHKLGDELSAIGNDENYFLFFELVMEWVANHVRQNAGSLVYVFSWSQLWQNLQGDILQTNIFNLDKKQTILTLFQMLFERNRKYG